MVGGSILRGRHDVQQNPGLDVLLGGFVKTKLGGPLGVIAFVRGIDTGFLDFQLVEDLYGL